MQTVPITAAVRNADFLHVFSLPKTLLVIEQDLSLVQMINNVLETRFRDLEWEYVTSGEQALELIERRARFRAGQPYSLVLTDIFLEGDLSGLDVWLDCQRKYPAMPFVVTSHMPAERYFSILRGTANCPIYIPKPLTVKGCNSVFEEYL